jgi:hypothetical protein
LFIDVARRILALASKRTKVGVRLDIDIMKEGVAIIRRQEISKSFGIKAMEPDGTIRLKGSDLIRYLSDYGSKWRFAGEQGPSAKL